ncbi:MAG: TetR/AcrR family transcriptional regulator [Deltaproteobacteria bacterium]|nr:TetR/AcrR family transcriptional regulator [Deltaproteobacteria bacterium]
MPSDPTAADPSPEVTDGRVLRARALKEERRAQIMDAGRRLFADRGYHGATIEDLIAEAGIARGTFYAHFESKRELFDQILEGFLARLGAVLVPVDVHSQVSPREQLRSNLVRVLRLTAENSDLTRVLFSAPGLEPELEDRIQAFHEKVLALIRRSLEAGVRIGLVRPGDLQAWSVYLLGAAKAAVGPHTFEGLDSHSHEQLAESLLDFVIGGLFRTPGGASSP